MISRQYEHSYRKMGLKYIFGVASVRAPMILDMMYGFSVMRARFFDRGSKC